MKTISETKLATFVVGSQKKTRFQKEKEAREAKKQAEMTEVSATWDVCLLSSLHAPLVPGSGAESVLARVDLPPLCSSRDHKARVWLRSTHEWLRCMELALCLRGN